MTLKLYQNVYPYLEWVLTFCTGFTLKVLLRILSIVSILNTAYPFRPKFYRTPENPLRGLCQPN